MNIQEFIDYATPICLAHKEIKSVYVGNTWDMAASKSNDIYPAVWFEFPVLTSYVIRNKKTYTFSMDVLMLPKQDDTKDELLKISECETIADDLLAMFVYAIPQMGLTVMNGLTVRNINADIACGIRVDFQIETNRNSCDVQDNFKIKIPNKTNVK